MKLSIENLEKITKSEFLIACAVAEMRSQPISWGAYGGKVWQNTGEPTNAIMSLVVDNLRRTLENGRLDLTT